jgi:anti-sigma regulatory factor (Ser/Thr protein kinase)
VVEASYPAVPGSVARARAHVAALAEDGGATEQRLISVCLAVSEALTNAVEHARENGEIYLRATVVSGHLVVLVANDRSQGQGMGFGLRVIASCSDHFMVSPTLTGGVQVEMRFDLQATEQAPHPILELASVL